MLLVGEADLVWKKKNVCVFVSTAKKTSEGNGKRLSLFSVTRAVRYLF